MYMYMYMYISRARTAIEHCQRDAIVAVEKMYANFSKAMHDNFSAERPAQPVLYLDATGGSLGPADMHATSNALVGEVSLTSRLAAPTLPAPPSSRAQL
eukprot:6200937-Pleurochrysis_carterae.AAC.3